MSSSLTLGLRCAQRPQTGECTGEATSVTVVDFDLSFVLQNSDAAMQASHVPGCCYNTFRVHMDDLAGIDLASLSGWALPDWAFVRLTGYSHPIHPNLI